VLKVHLSKAFVVYRKAKIVPRELSHFGREVRQEVWNINVGAPDGEDLRLGNVGDEARGFLKKIAESDSSSSLSRWAKTPASSV
jgi:hypothetical protein